MITNTACTVYNRHVVAGVETWYRHVLPAVRWENRKAANVIQSGLLAADSVTVYVPWAYKANYLAPIAWKNSAAKAIFWTLRPGDYLVKGQVYHELSSTFGIADLKKAHDDVVEIKSVDTHDTGSMVIRHWQVGAA